MGGRGVKRKIKGVYVHGNVGKLLLFNKARGIIQPSPTMAYIW